MEKKFCFKSPYFFIWYILIWLIVDLIWRINNLQPYWEDQIYYITGAIRLVQFDFHSFRELINFFLDSTGSQVRPPGAVFVLSFFYFLFPSLGIFRESTVFWFVLAFGVTYVLGRIVYSSFIGWLSIVFLSILLYFPYAYPIDANPELFLMVILPSLLFCFTSLWKEEQPQPCYWIASGILLATALLMKWIIVIFIAGPVLILFCDWVFRFKKHPADINKKVFYSCLFYLFFPAFLVITIWYLPNLQNLCNYFQKVKNANLFTVFHTGWNWQVPFFYPYLFLRLYKVIPTAFALTGLASVIIACFRFQNRVYCYRAGLLVSAILGFLFYYSIWYKNIPCKYLYPLLPVIAILSVQWISFVRVRRWKVFLCSLLCFYGVFCLCWCHFGAPFPPKRYVESRFFYVKPENWLLWYLCPTGWPPQKEEWPYEKIAESIARVEKGNAGNKRLVILSNMGFFYPFCMKPVMQAVCPNVQPNFAYQNDGLLNLLTADYFVSSRGCITSAYYTEFTNRTEYNALVTGRLLQQQPEWIARHYRQTDDFPMPQPFENLQLYQLVRAHDSSSVEQWCDFWLSYNLSEQDSWRQIRDAWRMIHDKKRADFDEQFSFFCQSKPQADWKRFLPQTTDSMPLLSYEKLQLGVWALETGSIADAETLLNDVIGHKEYSAWKAALLLGRLYMEQKEYGKAKKYLLISWRLNRDLPDAITLLNQLAILENNENEKKLFQRLCDLSTVMPMNPNFHTNREIVELLNTAGYQNDALGYLYRFFRMDQHQHEYFSFFFDKVVKPRYPSFTDQLMIPLLEHNQVTTLGEQDYFGYFIPGKIISFPFLHLSKGAYRLFWDIENTSNRDNVFSLSLDNRLLSDKTNEKEFFFSLENEADTLSIECIGGTGRFLTLLLEKVVEPIPFCASVVNSSAKDESGNNGENLTGYRFSKYLDWVYTFYFITDPLAWNYIQLQGLQGEAESIQFHFELRNSQGKAGYVDFSPAQSLDQPIPLPAEMKNYSQILDFNFYLKTKNNQKPKLLQINLLRYPKKN